MTGRPVAGAVVVMGVVLIMGLLLGAELQVWTLSLAWGLLAIAEVSAEVSVVSWCVARSQGNGR